jgi:hypothetical protein
MARGGSQLDAGIRKLGFARTRQILTKRGKSHFLMRLRAGLLPAPLLGSIWAYGQNKAGKYLR